VYLRRSIKLSMVIAATAAVVLAVRLGAAEPGNSYKVQNLVSDGFITTAQPPDPLLVNGWGIAASATSPWWVSAADSNSSLIYSGTGVRASLVVQVPGNPTGIVANSTTGFVVTVEASSGPARFIWAAEDGTISAWTPAIAPVTLSHVMVPNAQAVAHGASYKGLALAQTATGASFLYAADFHNNHVDVFDSAFHAVTLAGNFVDPKLPKGYAPFGIQRLGTKIFVSCAKQDAEAADEVAGEGLGFVSAFKLDGTFVRRVASRDALNAPWGMAMAPAGFGRFSGDLLVGNFGDGRINAFDPVTFEPKGHLKNTHGKAVKIDGLWGIGFGNGAGAGPTNVLYFAAGPEDEEHGLFGRIDAQ
jgi:uncharacterized protein (TIGR03118 family)